MAILPTTATKFVEEAHNGSCATLLYFVWGRGQVSLCLWVELNGEPNRAWMRRRDSDSGGRIDPRSLPMTCRTEDTKAPGKNRDLTHTLDYLEFKLSVEWCQSWRQAGRSLQESFIDYWWGIRSCVWRNNSTTNTGSENESIVLTTWTSCVATLLNRLYWSETDVDEAIVPLCDCVWSKFTKLNKLDVNTPGCPCY